MSGRGESKTSPRRVTAKMKQQRALDLRAGGATYEQIAQSPRDLANGDRSPLFPGEHGRKRAHEAVMAALEELRREQLDKAAELRALEMVRLDRQRLALNPEAAPSRPVNCPECGHTLWRETNVQAHNALIKITERTAKLFGLDASDEADGRMIELYEQQAALAQRAMVGAMERAGIPPDKQREVLEHAGDILREAADQE